MVDDFGVKYVGKQHAEHLINTIQEHYQVSTYWEVKLYCGINIKWNDKKQVVDLSMPGYIQVALNRFQQSPPTRKEHAPHSWEQRNERETQKLTKAEDTSKKTPQNVSLDYRKSQEHYYFMPKRLIRQYWSLWEQLQ